MSTSFFEPCPKIVKGLGNDQIRARTKDGKIRMSFKRNKFLWAKVEHGKKVDGKKEFGDKRV